MSERDLTRVIAIRPGALGDTLLVFPALALLRRSYPNAHVTFVARRDALPLARAWGLADTVSPYDAPEWSALFSVSPPTDSSSRSMLTGSTAIAWLAGADGLVAANLCALGADAVVIGPGRPREDIPTHAALQLAAALASLGVPVPADTAALYDTLPPPHLNPNDETSVAENIERDTSIPAWRAAGAAAGSAPTTSGEASSESGESRKTTPGASEPMPPARDDPDSVGASGGRPHPATHPHTGTVALHAGSGGAAKRWPPERFAALAREITGWGLCPILVEGPQDSDMTHAVLAETQRLGIELATARGLDLVDLARLLLGCDAYAGNDSGVSHLAGLLGLPTLAFFGPTDPAIWSPLGPHVHILRSPTASLADLPVPAVSAALRDLLGTL